MMEGGGEVKKRCVTSDYCLPFTDDPNELSGVGELNNVSTLECSDEKRLPCASAADAIWLRGSSHWVDRSLWLWERRKEEKT